MRNGQRGQQTSRRRRRWLLVKGLVKIFTEFSGGRRHHVQRGSEPESRRTVPEQWVDVIDRQVLFFLKKARKTKAIRWHGLVFFFGQGVFVSRPPRRLCALSCQPWPSVASPLDVTLSPLGSARYRSAPSWCGAGAHRRHHWHCKVASYGRDAPLSRTRPDFKTPNRPRSKPSKTQ